MSTSIGSELQSKNQVEMLPREHNMTTEQLIAKVHKDNSDVFEFLAQIHDKLGNGFTAYLFVMKRMNSQIVERIRKELDKRSYLTVSRKLFSIYRYKIANLTQAQKKMQYATAIAETEED